MLEHMGAIFVTFIVFLVRDVATFALLESKFGYVWMNTSKWPETQLKNTILQVSFVY